MGEGPAEGLPERRLSLPGLAARNCPQPRVLPCRAAPDGRHRHAHIQTRPIAFDRGGFHSGESAMIPMHRVNRRNVLRGMMGGDAVTVGLPFLDCLLDTN